MLDEDLDICPNYGIVPVGPVLLGKCFKPKNYSCPYALELNGSREETFCDLYKLNLVENIDGPSNLVLGVLEKKIRDKEDYILKVNSQIGNLFPLEKAS